MTGIPADASVLIYLSKAEAFALAAKCVGPLEVSPAVWREAAEAWEELDAEEVGRMRVAERNRILKRVELGEKTKRRAGDLAARHRLGAGESEVLALARFLKYRIGIIPIHWRFEADSKVTLSAYIRVFIDVFKIRWNFLTGAYKKK